MYAGWFVDLSHRRRLPGRPRAFGWAWLGEHGNYQSSGRPTAPTTSPVCGLCLTPCKDHRCFSSGHPDRLHIRPGLLHHLVCRDNSFVNGAEARERLLGCSRLTMGVRRLGSASPRRHLPGCPFRYYNWHPIRQWESSDDARNRETLKGQTRNKACRGGVSGHRAIRREYSRVPRGLERSRQHSGRSSGDCALAPRCPLRRQSTCLDRLATLGACSEKGW